MYKLLVVGRTASGKDTIVSRMEAKGLKVLRSYTTRPRREGEGNTHTFVTKEEAAIITDKIATTTIHGQEYFATRKQVEDCDIYIIDPNGVQELLQKMPDTTFHMVYVKADTAVRRKRFLQRDPSNVADFDARNASEDAQFSAFEEQVQDWPCLEKCPENLTQLRVIENGADGDLGAIIDMLMSDYTLYRNMHQMVCHIAEKGMIQKTDGGKLVLFTSDKTLYLDADAFTDVVLASSEGIASVTESYFRHGGCVTAT